MRRSEVALQLIVALCVSSCGDGAHTDGHDASAGVDDGSPIGVAPEFHSGTRLRAKVYAGGADARRFVTWHDTLLDADCQFTRAPDGSVRCYPTPGDSQVVFTDAACSVAVVQQPTGCGAVPTHSIELNPNSCDTPKVHKVGAPTARPVTTYARYSGACSATSDTVADKDFYDASVVVPADDFVAASVAREPRGARLAADVFRTADGAIDARSLVDVQRDAHCIIIDIDSAGTHSCVPIGRAFAIETFSDSGCANPVAIYFGSRYQPFCPEPAKLLRVSGVVGFFEVGAPYTGPVFSTQTGSCLPTSEAPSLPFFQVGDPVATSSFPPLSSVVEGTEQVRAVVDAAATGERLAAASFLDSTRGVACTPGRAADDQLRCFPQEDYSADLYSDVACTKHVALVPAGISAPTVNVRIEALTACGKRRLHGYAITGKRDALAPLYVDTSGMCIASTQSGDFDYYDTGAELPASSFGATPLVLE